MARPEIPNPASTVDLRVELDRSWLADRPLPDRVLAAFRDALQRGADALAETLGVPGHTSATVTLETAIVDGRLFRLVVNGSICRYPDELLLWVDSYVRGEHVDAVDRPDTVLQRIHQRDVTDLIRFLTGVCLETIKLQPAALLALPQAEAFVASLTGQTTTPQPDRLPAPAWLLPILQAVLDARLSIADRPAIAAALADLPGLSELEATEQILVALAAEHIGIHVSSELLAQFGGADADSSRELFKYLRDGMAAEQGLVYPPFELVVDEDLAPWSFAFCLGRMTTTPIVGLRPDECLVNDTVKQLSRFTPPFDARAALNPATGLPSAVIGASERARAEASGRTAWDSRQHLILSFAAALRTYGHCFVNTRMVSAQIDRARTVAPAAADAVMKRYSIEQLTALLRSLVEEQVSIRNIHLVLTSALEYAELRDADAAIDGHSGAGRPSHDPAALVAFVRASAKHELRDKLARGTDTVVAYLFDQTVEHMLSQELRRLPGDEDIDRILGALRGELAYLPPTAQRPVLLTGHRSRTMLRKVVALEFPRLFVVAHGELPRDANVQPVARIALP